MSLTIPNSEADLLLNEIYKIIQNPKKLETDREILEKRLKKVIDLRWEDSNVFESYFAELNRVLGAMSQMDFTQRMQETDDPESLLNLIAVSFNRINDRLEENYVGMEFIPELMDSIKVNNRIVLVSSDKLTINRGFANIEDLNVNIKGLINQPVSWVISQRVLTFLIAEEGSYYEYTGELSAAVFPTLENRKAHFSVKNGKHLIVTITLYPDNVIEENKDRLLQLVRGLNQHFENHPEAVKSLHGLAYSLELKSLADQLLPYINKKFPPQQKPLE